MTTTQTPSSGTSVTTPADSPTKRKLQVVYTQERAMTIVAILLIVLFSITAPAFLGADNLLSVASSAAYFAIVGVGMTVLFIVGEFDLSLGAIYGLTGTMIAFINTTYYGPWMALLIALIMALAIGLLNGFFTTVGRVPSFIVTIGMLSVLQGIAQYLSGGQPVTLEEDAANSVLTKIANFSPLQIPPSVILAAVIMIGTAIFLRTTRLGAHIFLVGGSEKASRQVGINTTRVKLFCFLFAALLAALAGAVQTFQLGTAQPGTGGGDFLFQAVGAAIIGGVALTGGAGSIYGTFVGAAILGILNNGLVLSGIDPGLGVTVTGALIILAGVLQAGMRQLIADLFRRSRIRASRQAAR
jgi:ribose/xylose/arabinose/galactoside ABC-type transport system permease subunit